MNSIEFENRLAKGIDHVYVFTGTDDFVKREGLELLKKALKSRDGQESEFVTFDASDVEIKEVLDELRTMPMFGGGRFVVLENADKLFVKRGQPKSDAESLENLKKYCQNPSDFAVLVMTAVEEVSRTKKSKFEKPFPMAVILEARPLYENEVPAWIRARAKKYKLNYSGEVPELLSGFFGADLSEIDNALEKLSLFALEEKVTSEDVRGFIKRRVGYDVFRFTDTIGTRNLKAALEMAGDIFDAGIINQDGSRDTNAAAIFQRLLPMILREFKLMYSVRRLAMKIKDHRELVGALGMNPFVAKKAIEHARNYSQEDCIKAEEELLFADNAIKTGEFSDVKILLEKALVAVMNVKSVGVK